MQELNECALQVGGELPKLHRKVFCALITGDVHNRDIVTDMVKEKVDSPHSFTWQMQLRFYWDVEIEIDDCVLSRLGLRRLPTAAGSPSRAACMSSSPDRGPRRHGQDRVAEQESACEPRVPRIRGQAQCQPALRGD